MSTHQRLAWFIGGSLDGQQFLVDAETEYRHDNGEIYVWNHLGHSIGVEQETVHQYVLRDDIDDAITHRPVDGETNEGRSFGDA